jgi:hypothetical protein
MTWADSEAGHHRVRDLTGRAMEDIIGHDVLKHIITSSRSAFLCRCVSKELKSAVQQTPGINIKLSSKGIQDAKQAFFLQFVKPMITCNLGTSDHNLITEVESAVNRGLLIKNLEIHSENYQQDTFCIAEALLNRLDENASNVEAIGFDCKTDTSSLLPLVENIRHTARHCRPSLHLMVSKTHTSTIQQNQIGLTIGTIQRLIHFADITALKLRLCFRKSVICCGKSGLLLFAMDWTCSIPCFRVPLSSLPHFIRLRHLIRGLVRSNFTLQSPSEAPPGLDRLSSLTSLTTLEIWSVTCGARGVN